MFTNLQLRTKPHRRKSSMAARSGVSKRRVSQVLLASASEAPSLSFMEGLFGDEFPDTFRGADGSSFKSRKTLMDVPAELLCHIGSYLRGADLKRLRLVNKQLAEKVELRFERVYISASYANINCLRNIIRHPQFKYQVREIVWDEAQLAEFPGEEQFRIRLQQEALVTKVYFERLFHGYIEAGQNERTTDDRTPELEDFFDGESLTEAGRSILLQQEHSCAKHILFKVAPQMSVEESFELYQELCQDQKEIWSHNFDASIFHEALSELPNLKRVTLTPEVWGEWNLSPVYETPFHRSLPPGFRKPSVNLWVNTIELPHAKFSQLSRSFKIVIDALSKRFHPQIEEFVADASSFGWGITDALFTERNGVVEDMAIVAEKHPLKRFSMKISSGRRGADHKSGIFKAVLGKMHHLEHLDLNLHSAYREAKRVQYGSSRSLVGMYLGWQDIFPSGLLQRLKTFTLRDTKIQSEGFCDMIAQLENVNHITLDNIQCFSSYPRDIPRWIHIFNRLKANYTDMPAGRTIPRITMIHFFDDHGFQTHRNWLIEEEIGDFFQGREDALFSQDGFLNLKAGWIVDSIDPTFRLKSTPEYWAKIKVRDRQ